MMQLTTLNIYKTLLLPNNQIFGPCKTETFLCHLLLDVYISMTIDWTRSTLKYWPLRTGIHLCEYCTVLPEQRH